MALFAAAMLVGSGIGLGAQDCEPPATVDLITGASRSQVRAVVEYEVIAENPSGIGKSVAATRRIWGDVVVDRWTVTPAGSDCSTTPTRALGDRWYLLVGPVDAGPLFGVPSGEEISDLEAGALASIVGEPVLVGIGTVDRAMAWMRVYWWLVAGAILPLVVVVAVIVRRRAGARRDYLF